MSTQTDPNGPGARGAGEEEESPAIEEIEELEDEVEIEQEEFEEKRRMLESLKIRIESQSGDLTILDDALSAALERISDELGLEPDDCEPSGVTPWSGIGFRVTYTTSCLGQLSDSLGRRWHVVVEIASGYNSARIYAELTKVELYPVEQEDEGDDEYE